jgi:hypothetical protein
MPNMKTTLLATVVGLLTLLQAAPTPPPDTRVFELRTYHTASPAKLEALHARFRDHSIRLLQKHGMTLVGFWVPTDADKGAGNTLVYLVAHKSREAATASWKAFGEDPEWQKARAESEKDGRLAEKVDSVFMSPTDYSAMR